MSGVTTCGDMRYICEKCAELNDADFVAACENHAGRKACWWCGFHPSRLDLVIVEPDTAARDA